MSFGVLPSWFEQYPAKDFCLPGFQWDGNLHHALKKSLADDELERYVTMVRAPRQRLLSAFGEGAHDCSVHVSKVFPMRTVWRGACKVATYARALGVEGCTTNMVTGCAYPHVEEAGHCSSREAVLGAAERRLERFGFVGLLEEWELSVRLLLAIYGGEAHASELGNSRATKIDWHDDEADQGAANCSGATFSAHWHDESELELSAGGGLTMEDLPHTPLGALDPLDTELYRFAVRLFYERAARAGLLSSGARSFREACLLSRTCSDA